MLQIWRCAMLHRREGSKIVFEPLVLIPGVFLVASWGNNFACVFKSDVSDLNRHRDCPTRRGNFACRQSDK